MESNPNTNTNKSFNKLSKNVFNYLLTFTSYGDFPKYLTVNKQFLENIRQFIKIKVHS